VELGQSREPGINDEFFPMQTGCIHESLAPSGRRFSASGVNRQGRLVPIRGVLFYRAIHGRITEGSRARPSPPRFDRSTSGSSVPFGPFADPCQGATRSHFPFYYCRYASDPVALQGKQGSQNRTHSPQANARETNRVTEFNPRHGD
jgi:hypothetical protein